MTTYNFAEIADEVAAVEQDANSASAGGGTYVPPPKGLARLRLVGYIEIGKHVQKVKGKPDKVEDKAWLIFELSGKGYEPRVLDDGIKIPMRITVKLNHSLNEKATYYKLFRRMNFEQKATSFIQLLGQAFIGNVGHFTIPGEAGKPETVTANFRDSDGNLTIRPPRVEVLDEDGEMNTVTLKVDEAVSPQRCLIWGASDKYLPKMWTSLFIPDAEAAEGDAAKTSRNVYQNTIKAALNFEGSPVQAYLSAAGVDLGIPAAEDNKSSAKPDADDPLNGVG